MSGAAPSVVLEGRFVAAFRATGGPGTFLDRAQVLVARLTGVGAVHVGLDAQAVSFAIEPAKLEAVLDAAFPPDGEPLWAVGLAQGDLATVSAAGSPLLESGLLYWSRALAAAAMLARAARAGEILADATMSLVVEGRLAIAGYRTVDEGDARVRGARASARQPWSATALANLARMPATLPLRGHRPALELVPGRLAVVRAEAGAGGSRCLRELAGRALRSLVVSPVGSGVEPLGALRSALQSAIGREVNPRLLEHAPALEALLAGKGASCDTAAALVTALLWPKQGGDRAVLAIDDAGAVDAATLDACARAVKGSAHVALVVRLDAAEVIPVAFSALPKVNEIVLGRLDSDAAAALAADCTGGALDEAACRRWARLGGGKPLAIVEAIAAAIARAEIVWTGDRAMARSRAAGRGAVRPAAESLRLRANAEDTPARALLSLLAVLGGDATVGFLERVFESAGFEIDVVETVTRLARGRWLLDPTADLAQGTSRSGWRITFASRTHQTALFETLDEETRRTLHAAAARVLAHEEGLFARAEGAWHAMLSGDDGQAATLLEAARVAGDAGFAAASAQLIALASGEPLDEPDSGIEHAMIVGPPPSDPVAPEPPDSEPVTLEVEDPDEPTIETQVGSTRSTPSVPVDRRLVDLARTALVEGDAGVLDRAVAILRPPGSRTPDDAELLRTLRRARTQLAPKDYRGRCETSLALAVALSTGDQAQEALLDALDALARARQSADARGVRVCLAFLAKLYGSVDRTLEAERLLGALR